MGSVESLSNLSAHIVKSLVPIFINAIFVLYI